MDDNTLLVDIQDVGLQFNKQEVLRKVNFQVHRNEIVTLIGPNGAGKSSLVKIILGLLKPDSGKVKMQGGISVGYMPQSLTISQLLPLSVYKFLMYTKGADHEVCLLVAEQLGLTKLLSSPMHSISGGEKQRVLLARAILNKPDLLVLDEPVQGVDINGQDELYKLIKRIKDSLGCGVLLISHDLHIVMADTNQVVCLNQHICCSGLPEAVTSHPEFVNLFGSDIANKLAVYTHKHDHHHDLEGNIIND